MEAAWRNTFEILPGIAKKLHCKSYTLGPREQREDTETRSHPAVAKGTLPTSDERNNNNTAI